MYSSGYDIFITLEEWLDVLELVDTQIPYFGIIRYWPKRRYDLLEGADLSTKAKMPNAFSIIIRSTKIDFSKGLRYYFENPVHECMIHIDVPRIWPSNRLIYVHVGIRADDCREGLPSPIPLFQLIKREFRRICRKPLIRAWDGRVSKGLGYTAGALRLYDEGYELSTGAKATGIFIPGERWAALDQSLVRIDT